MSVKSDCGVSYRGAHGVAHTEVKAALFVHGVVQTRELRQGGPVVVEGVVTETVVGSKSGREINRMRFNCLCFPRVSVCLCLKRAWVSLQVASQLLHATSGPVEAVEGSLHQRGHDAAHVHLVSTAVPLAVVLHPQPARREREGGREGGRETERERGRQNETYRRRQIRNVWEEKYSQGTKEGGGGQWSKTVINQYRPLTNGSVVCCCAVWESLKTSLTYTCPVSCATTKAEEKPSSWFKVQLLTGWHMPVTGA